MPLAIRAEQAAALAGPDGSACAPCQSGPRPATRPGPVLPNEPADSWLAVRLVDQRGRPLANEPTTIELDTGQVLRGRTNAQGVVRFDGVPHSAGIAQFDDIPDRTAFG